MQKKSIPQSDVDKRIVDYIRVNLSKGFSKTGIKKALLGAKHKPEVVERAFKYLEQKPETTRDHNRLGNGKNRLMLITVVVIIIAVSAVFLHPESQVRSLQRIDGKIVRLVHSRQLSQQDLAAGTEQPMGEWVGCDNESENAQFLHSDFINVSRQERLRICGSFVYERYERTPNDDNDSTYSIKAYTGVMGFNNDEAAMNAFTILITIPTPDKTIMDIRGTHIVDFKTIVPRPQLTGPPEEYHNIYFIKEKTLIEVIGIMDSSTAERYKEQVADLLV